MIEKKKKKKRKAVRDRNLARFGLSKKRSAVAANHDLSRNGLAQHRSVHRGPHGNALHQPPRLTLRPDSGAASALEMTLRKDPKHSSTQVRRGHQHLCFPSSIEAFDANVDSRELVCQSGTWFAPPARNVRRWTFARPAISMLKAVGVSSK